MLADVLFFSKRTVMEGAQAWECGCSLQDPGSTHQVTLGNSFDRGDASW